MGGDDEGAFTIGPAAFGSEQESDVIVGLSRGGERGEERGLGFFVEKEPRGGSGGEGLLQGQGLVEDGETEAARLLAGFLQDALPTRQSFGGGELEAFFAALGDDEMEGSDAKFGGFFKDPFEAIVFDERAVEAQLEGLGCGGELFENTEADLNFAGDVDFGEVELLIVRDLEDLAFFDAQDAGEMFGFITEEDGVALLYGGNEEAAAGHLHRVALGAEASGRGGRR